MPPILGDDEQRICSLVSDKHSYEELRDVIVETCLHQRQADLRWFVEWGEEYCHSHFPPDQESLKKDCIICWCQLKDKLAELEG